MNLKVHAEIARTVASLQAPMCTLPMKEKVDWEDVVKQVLNHHFSEDVNLLLKAVEVAREKHEDYGCNGYMDGLLDGFEMALEGDGEIPDEVELALRNIKEMKKKENDPEYKQYLKLKAKFEGK